MNMKHSQYTLCFECITIPLTKIQTLDATFHTHTERETNIQTLVILTYCRCCCFSYCHPSSLLSTIANYDRNIRSRFHFMHFKLKWRKSQTFVIKTCPVPLHFLLPSIANSHFQSVHKTFVDR